jgi:uncharacterized protein YndB with AHSA1/START domain
LTSSSSAVTRAADVELVITRTFDAPRKLVFQAFSESSRLAEWWGPKGLEITVSRLDFRPGGVFHYSMTAPDGTVMWARMVYREIVPPERIVWVNSFADEAGNLVPVPFGDEWPPEMLCTVTLAEQDGNTLLTLRVIPVNASELQTVTFGEQHDSMREGFGGTFDKLDDHLAPS